MVLERASSVDRTKLPDRPTPVVLFALVGSRGSVRAENRDDGRECDLERDQEPERLGEVVDELEDAAL
jgi:hypothetical protein